MDNKEDKDNEWLRFLKSGVRPNPEITKRPKPILVSTRQQRGIKHG